MTYTARWVGNGASTEHLPRLCVDVYRSLRRMIHTQIKQHSALPPLEGERLRHHRAGVLSVSVTQEGRRAVSTHGVWDLASGQCRAVFAGSAPVLSCGLARNGRLTQSAIQNPKSSPPGSHCQHPLQFNPFFAAADDYAEVLHAGERKKAEGGCRREKGDVRRTPPFAM